MYARTLFQAITGHWENELTGQEWELAGRDLVSQCENLRQLQGKSWTPRGVSFRVCGDASATADAGSSALLSAPVIYGHTEEEQERMKAQKLSSCFRETKNARLCIAALLSEQPDKVRGCVVQYIGDNQGSIHCLNNMSGNAEIFEEVKLLHIQAAKLDVLLDFQWQPRTTEALKYADKLSRTQDHSQISLNRKAFVKVCSRKGWGYPTLDVFAGPLPEEHKATRYFTKFACEGTLGVNAMVQKWVIGNSVGRVLLWVFPPTELIGQVLAKLKFEKSPAIIVLPPARGQYWMPILQSLRINACMNLDYNAGL